MEESSNHKLPSEFPFSKPQKGILAANPDLKELLDGRTMGEYDLSNLKAKAEGIVKESEQALLDGDLERFNQLGKIHKPSLMK